MTLKKTVTVRQMKAIDRNAIEKIGIPAVCLMENAGREVAEAAMRMLARRGKRVVIVCGSGNNGGDGFVAARHLRNRGVKVAIVFAGSAARLTEEAAVNYRAARRLKIPIHKSDSAGLRTLGGADLIVDALFGVGLSRALGGAYAALVEAMNGAGAAVLSVDVPSGLDGTTGKVLGTCVRAHTTLTLAYPKTGLFIADGPGHAGRVVVADIGIPY